MRSVLPYVWYPLFFALAIAMFAFMLDGSAPLLAALYLPIALVAVCIVVLELLDPERRDWRPVWRDVRADAAFMIVVQVVMPRVLCHWPCSAWPRSIMTHRRGHGHIIGRWRHRRS
ncbi:MAG: hypothetical protein ABL878_05585 [Burkholderiales bacterium]